MTLLHSTGPLTLLHSTLRNVMALYRTFTLPANGVTALPGREEMAVMLSRDKGKITGHSEESAGYVGNLSWRDLGHWFKAKRG